MALGAPASNADRHVCLRKSERNIQEVPRSVGVGLFGAGRMPPAEDGDSGGKMESDAQAKLTQGQVEWILHVRRERAAEFGEGLFSEPAWDILLELLAAELGHRKVALADLAHIAPASTVARWVAALEERGLLKCDVDPFQPDQMWVELSRGCLARLLKFLSGVSRLAESV